MWLRRALSAPPSALGASSASSWVRRSITVRRFRPASAARPVSSRRCSPSERSRVRHRIVPPPAGYPPGSRRLKVPGSAMCRSRAGLDGIPSSDHVLRREYYASGSGTANCLPAYDAAAAADREHGEQRTPVDSQEMTKMSHVGSQARQRVGPLGGLGRGCHRHRWLTLLVWIAGLACMITLWMRFGAAADDSYGSSDPGQALLNAHFHRQSGDALTLAIRSSGDISSAAARAQITSALIPFRGAAGVTAVPSPYPAPGQISRDGHTAFATIQFGVPSAKIGGSETQALVQAATAASGHGMTFSLGGDVVDLAETPYGGPTEGIGTVAAAIVLLIAFGSLLAMGLPIVTALFGIGTGLSLIALLGHIFPAPSFSPIGAAMIGLGVGGDYALFIVTRFREALRSGQAPEDAAATAMRTAGRSVLTASTTVAIGMLGLLVLRQQLLNGVAVAAAATVAMTVLGSLTLLPALLGFAGTRLARQTRIRVPGFLRRRSSRPGQPQGQGQRGNIRSASPPAAEPLAGVG